jgi:hypothetical protein
MINKIKAEARKAGWYNGTKEQREAYDAINKISRAPKSAGKAKVELRPKPKTKKKGTKK